MTTAQIEQSEVRDAAEANKNDSEGSAARRYTTNKELRAFKTSMREQRLAAADAAEAMLAALKAWEAAIPRIDEFGSVAPGSLRGRALAAIAAAESAGIRVKD